MSDNTCELCHENPCDCARKFKRKMSAKPWHQCAECLKMTDNDFPICRQCSANCSHDYFDIVTVEDGAQQNYCGNCGARADSGNTVAGW